MNIPIIAEEVLSTRALSSIGLSVMVRVTFLDSATILATSEPLQPHLPQMYPFTQESFQVYTPCMNCNYCTTCKESWTQYQINCSPLNWAFSLIRIPSRALQQLSIKGVSIPNAPIRLGTLTRADLGRPRSNRSRKSRQCLTTVHRYSRRKQIHLRSTSTTNSTTTHPTSNSIHPGSTNPTSCPGT